MWTILENFIICIDKITAKRISTLITKLPTIFRRSAFKAKYLPVNSLTRAHYSYNIERKINWYYDTPIGVERANDVHSYIHHK